MSFNHPINTAPLEFPISENIMNEIRQGQKVKKVGRGNMVEEASSCSFIYNEVVMQYQNVQEPNF